MTEQSFSLIPFPASKVPEISITGQISLQENLLAVHYSLTGKTAGVSLPSVSPHPGRRHELWKMTCFEFFLAVQDQPQYWEFNMSPSGDWNVYRMDDYRRVGFREETSIHGLRIEFQQASGAINLHANVDLNPILQKGELLEIGIATILHTNDGNETYWALSYPAPHADFHLRDSFILALEGQNQLSE